MITLHSVKEVFAVLPVRLLRELSYYFTATFHVLEIFKKKMLMKCNIFIIYAILKVIFCIKIVFILDQHISDLQNRKKNII